MMKRMSSSSSAQGADGQNGRAIARRPTSLSYALRALGRDELPMSISIAGTPYRRVQIVKHDFYAATGFYDDARGTRVVLKIGRLAPFMGVPMNWLGAWLCGREMRFYRRLADVAAVPPLLGRVGASGLVHGFVPGRPLGKEGAVPDGFFDDLMALVGELHRRDIAYVDTNKPQNILLGDDGKPHLIDFQISYDLTELGNNFVNRAILRRLQREDVYHLLKHKKRLRPDLMSDEQRQIVQRKSWLIRLHRFVTRPYFKIRRRWLQRMRDRGELIEAGSD
jgi:hypothetical protein